MKNIILILSIIATISATGQDTIPNHGFEFWNPDMQPAYWQTTNLLLPFGISNVTQTGNSAVGDRAIYLETIEFDEFIVPGVATTGVIDFGTTFGGVPFTARPLSFSGFVRHPSNGDEIIIAVDFLKNGFTIGDCVWSTSDSLPDFIQFTAPVNFYTAENPDTMNITILTDPLKTGSTLIVDDLSFEFPTTMVPLAEWDQVYAYPNPFRDYIFLNPEININSFSIYNSSGQLILHESGNTKIYKIDGSALEPGLYILAIKTPKGYIRRKFQKLN